MTPIIEASEQRMEESVNVPDGLELDCYKREIKRPGDSEPSECFSLIKKDGDLKLSSSYFIGVDWLDEERTAIRISPKFNGENGNVQVDYLSMLEEALKEPKNFEHLEGLLYVDFNRPCIDIPRQDDTLSLFLMSEFISVMYSITRKGLKKAYYQVEENLNSKIKGKLLTVRNISKNNIRGDFSRNYCRYQEYGIDIPENRLLKAALVEASRTIESYKEGVDVSHLTGTVRAIMPKWEKVSTNERQSLLNDGKSNAFYKEYPIAIRLAKLILKHASINQVLHGTNTAKTPPYWIDMSKLFEMYVLKFLRERFSDKVEYHVGFRGGQEPDYLLHGDGNRPSYIIDAKYKRYGERAIEVNDIRQVSGYARLKDVRKRLGVYQQSIIPCLIIHPDLEGNATLPDHTAWTAYDSYEEIYKVGIRLPLTALDNANHGH